MNSQRDPALLQNREICVLYIKCMKCVFVLFLCLCLIRHKHLHSVRGGVTGRLGVPHVQSHRQLPSVALLFLLYNTHLLLGVARQGDHSHFPPSPIVSVACKFSPCTPGRCTNVSFFSAFLYTECLHCGHH